MTRTNAIPDYFGAMYRDVSINPTHETLTIRWEGVRAALDAVDKNLLLTVLLLAQSLPVTADQAKPFQRFFLDIDTAFDLANFTETGVLAAVFLRELLKSKKRDTATAAAMTLHASNARGIRNLRTSKPLLEEAATFVHARAVTIRRWEIPERSSPKLSLEGEANDIAAQIERLASGIRSIHNSVDARIGQIALALDVQQEQSDILWWLMGEYSFLLGAPLGDLSVPTAAAAAAIELAERVRFSPPPLASSAFLRKALSGHAKREDNLSLRELMTAFDESLKARLPQRKAPSLPDALLPITSVCAGKGSFVEGIDSTGLDGLDTPIAPANFGQQLLSEIMANAAFAELESPE